MSIADQLKNNSKLANIKKAKRSLAKTLAEKREKAQILAAQKEKERVAIERKKQQEKAEQKKRAIESANLRTLKKYFDDFYLTAWHGSSIFVTTERDANRDQLLKPFGLKILSTEKHSEKLNGNLSVVNSLIEDINAQLINIGFKGNALIPECSPKDICSNDYAFGDIWSIRNKLLSDLIAKSTQKIKTLEELRASIKNEIDYTKNATTKLALQLKKLAGSYSREDSKEFKENYELLLHNPPTSILNNIPELKKLTYAERIDNRDYQYHIAKEVFSRLNLKLPSLEQMQLSTKSQISNKASLFSEADGIGRYIAFFRIFCGGDPYSAILRSVKEKIHSNNAEDLIHEENRLGKTELLLESARQSLKEIDINNLRKIASEISRKITNLRKSANGALGIITFNLTSFMPQYFFDIKHLHSPSVEIAPFSQFIDEISWLISKDGMVNVKKLMRALENASTKGLRTLSLTYKESDKKLIFQRDGKKLFELAISLENFLAMIKKDKLSYTLKMSKSSNVLTIKWL
ncbi:hypothetical protein G6701_00055 [Polynucleobacter paneuropaeus]|nr:hypothetical protein [Polynucleobacter paneuropaeus]